MEALLQSNQAKFGFMILLLLLVGIITKPRI